MLNSFWSENGWEFINCIIQAVISISAWITILLTRRQVSSTTRVKLKMYTDFRADIQDGEAVVEIALHIVNQGMAPVYIQGWGIELRGYRHKDYRLSISTDLFELEPGRPYVIAQHYPGGKIDDMASLHDRVRIYVQYQLNELYYSRKKCSYDEFRHEFEKVNHSINSVNSEVAEME